MRNKGRLEIIMIILLVVLLVFVIWASTAEAAECKPTLHVGTVKGPDFVEQHRTEYDTKPEAVAALASVGGGLSGYLSLCNGGGMEAATDGELPTCWTCFALGAAGVTTGAGLALGFTEAHPLFAPLVNSKPWIGVPLHLAVRAWLVTRARTKPLATCKATLATTNGLAWGAAVSNLVLIAGGATAPAGIAGLAAGAYAGREHYRSGAAEDECNGPRYLFLEHVKQALRRDNGR